ncbi:MAG TPA: ABC transporter permease [Candidatus Limnocylindria bacterium]|nr:ABC transporter permease [Candidatus Limnocylindria bacterium]
MKELARFASNLPLVLGLAGVVLIAVVALFGPQLASSDPQAQRVIVFYPGGRFEAPPTPPDQYYPLGTDPLGRDQLSRLLWGARLTLGATLLGLAGRTIVGLALGLLAGWRRGPVDTAVVWLTNAVGGFPQLMLALLLVVALRDLGFLGFVIALAAVGWADLAQFVRSEVLRVRASAYVDAARALGARGSHVLRAHVLRGLAPQLAGVVALEAGSVLLLLAELGFIGLFISGGTFYVDDSNRPILPVRDRAPEWGQMLAGARQYAFSHQYVAFVPGVVVVAAVFAFNLFGEGLRSASDPFGAKRLSPRTLGALGRVLAALALVGVVGYGVASARSTEIAFPDAMRAAREAAARVDPKAELVAGVVRFRSSAHALARPEKLNFYFRQPGEETVLRVGWVDADPNAMEVKRFDVEDELPFRDLRPIEEPAIAWQQALRFAEDRGGGQFRVASNDWTVRVVLQRTVEEPVYKVAYLRRNAVTPLEYALSATTGDVARPAALGPDAFARARDALGGPVSLVQHGATWRWSPRIDPTAPGATRPNTISYAFAIVDAPARTFSVTYDPVRGGEPRTGAFPVPPGSPALPADIDVVDAFGHVEDAGGRNVRTEWERSQADWFAFARASVVGAGPVVDVTYSRQTDGTSLTFRYDVRTGRVSRL